MARQHPATAAAAALSAPVAATPHLTVAAALVAYCAAANATILLNKLAVDTFDLHFPMCLVLLQNACSVAFVLLGRRAGLVRCPAMTAALVWRWLPLTLCFAGMLWTGMAALRYTPVAILAALKNTAVVFTATGERVMFGRAVTVPMVAAFAAICAGAFLGGSMDKEITGTGLWLSAANVALTVSYTLGTKRILVDAKGELGHFGPVLYSNTISLPFIAIAAAPSAPAFAAAAAALSAAAAAVVALTIVVGAGLSFAVFFALRYCSATSFAVSGSVNKIPLALLGMALFGHRPAGAATAGIVLSIAGGLLYTAQALQLGRGPPLAPAGGAATGDSTAGGGAAAGCGADGDGGAKGGGAAAAAGGRSPVLVPGGNGGNGARPSPGSGSPAPAPAPAASEAEGEGGGSVTALVSATPSVSRRCSALVDSAAVSSMAPMFGPSGGSPPRSYVLPQSAGGPSSAVSNGVAGAGHRV